MKVRVNYGLCETNGLCAKASPEVFEIREEEDRMRLLQVHPDESLRSGVEEAVRRCPKTALRLEE